MHHNLITFAQGRINQHLPADLRARVEERDFVESLEGPGRSMYRDIRVVEKGWSHGGANGAASGVAVAAPLVIEMPEEQINQGFIEIIDVGSGNKVVTVIEVLSLSNKAPGEGQELYLTKQRELKQGRVSLVDLLRAGEQGSIPGKGLFMMILRYYMLEARRPDNAHKTNPGFILPDLAVCRTRDKFNDTTNLIPRTYPKCPQ